MDTIGKLVNWLCFWHSMFYEELKGETSHWISFQMLSATESNHGPIWFIWRNLHLIFINWGASLTPAHAWSPLSAIWSSITQNIFNHKIFSCAPNIFMSNRKNIFLDGSNTFSRRAIWDLSGQKLNKFSTNYNVSNNGKILWKCQIWFWLFLPDKAESRASEEEERNFFRLSTTTSHPLTPSSILTRTSL